MSEVIKPLTKFAEPLSQDKIEAEAVRLSLEIYAKTVFEKSKTEKAKEVKETC